MSNDFNKTLRKPPRGTRLRKDHPLCRGLVGFWPFWEGAGEYANDISGFNNRAQLFNLPIPGNGTLAGWTTSKYGPSLAFDSAAANQYSYVSPAPAIALLTGNMSVSATFLLRATGSSCVITGVAKNSLLGDSWEMGYTGTVIRFIWNTLGGGNAAFTPSANVWYDVVFTRFGVSGSWDYKIYADGALDTAANSATDPSIFSVTTDAVCFGARASSVSQGQFLPGIISDVRLWNRPLTAAEVEELHNQRFSMFESPSYRKYFFQAATATAPIAAFRNANQLLGGGYVS